VADYEVAELDALDGEAVTRHADALAARRAITASTVNLSCGSLPD
jgi:hypothetical protein